MWKEFVGNNDGFLKSPPWLATLLISLASIGLTLIFDRVTLAATISNISSRVATLEEEYKETKLMHMEIIQELHSMEINQQSILDRQDEMRRKLHIN